MSWVTVRIAIALVVVVGAVYLVWVLWSNRRRGVSGFVRTVPLTCPKCQGRFDYAFVPGASVTAFRLGTGRYLACPVCRRWSYFPLTPQDAAPPPQDGRRRNPPAG